MKSTAAPIALCAFALATLTNCAARSTAPSPSLSPAEHQANQTVRKVQSRELKSAKYVLKTDLDFSKGEKRDLTLLKGRDMADQVPTSVVSIVQQKGVTAKEADQASSACSLSARVRGAEAPKFLRTSSFQVTDFGVLTTADASNFEMILTDEFGMSFKLRCRNVADSAGLEAQIGHIFHLGR